MKFLDRALLHGPFLTLVTSQKEFKKVLKYLKLQDYPDNFVNEGSDATTHTFISEHGNLTCVVGFIMNDAHSEIENLGLLVHEAVHVWQHVRAQIVSTIDTSRTGGLEAEMEAYAIQNISQNLIEEFQRRVKSKPNNGEPVIQSE